MRNAHFLLCVCNMLSVHATQLCLSVYIGINDN